MCIESNSPPCRLFDLVHAHKSWRLTSFNSARFVFVFSSFSCTYVVRRARTCCWLWFSTLAGFARLFSSAVGIAKLTGYTVAKFLRVPPVLSVDRHGGFYSGSKGLEAKGSGPWMVDERLLRCRRDAAHLSQEAQASQPAAARGRCSAGRPAVGVLFSLHSLFVIFVFLLLRWPSRTSDKVLCTYCTPSALPWSACGSGSMTR